MINNSQKVLKRIIERTTRERNQSTGININSYYSHGYQDALDIVLLIIKQELEMDSQITIEEVLKNENTRVTI